MIDEYSPGREALKGYLAHHRRSPEREFYVFHTARERMEAEERDMLGLRPGPSRTPPGIVEPPLQK